ncbi:MAG TPA: carboxyl transferase domain-containing protein, partial [Solirubrobacteraceae bacterium]|nr:carboxyl transferase domain-containing protein [Solirubrobacteraceae bacterium]
MAEAPRIAVSAPFAAVVASIAHARGEEVAAGSVVAVLEAMKMEHEIVAQTGGVVERVAVSVGDAVAEGDVLLTLHGNGAASTEHGERPRPGQPAPDQPATRKHDPEAPRADLEAVVERHGLGLDEARPEAVAKRRERGRRTARENLSELVDEGTFVEYGPLLFAAQEGRRAKEELIRRTPADGLVGGVGDVEGRPCVAMSYDYTVLAGTQGMRNHAKKDRLFELAERRRLPVVLFAEGGGGRPGDVDMPIVAGLDCRAFELFARLSGLVPLVGIASGYCFAGNAALLGCCDVVIASEDASIGM